MKKDSSISIDNTSISNKGKILILGGGYVGTYLSSRFKKDGIPHSVKTSKDVDYKSVDSIKSALSGFGFIINCVGYTGTPNVDACEQNKDLCMELNKHTATRIAGVCAEHNKTFIQIGTGCIYNTDSNGVDIAYRESDPPNFGIAHPNSSFYSRVKHMTELRLTDIEHLNGLLLRIRMPFDDKVSNKNYLTKLYNYKNLISHRNSVTDMTDVYKAIISYYNNVYLERIDGDENIFSILNCVSGSITAKEIVDIFKKLGHDRGWTFVDEDDLNLVAKRSNCVLDNRILRNLVPDDISIEDRIEKAIIALYGDKRNA